MWFLAILRDLLIDEQSHVSRRRNALRPAFTLSGVSKARPDVFWFQLRKFLQDLRLVLTGRQVSENIANRDPGPAHAGLTEPNRRIDVDAIQEAHVRQSRVNPAATAKSSPGFMHLRLGAVDARLDYWDSRESHEGTETTLRGEESIREGLV